VHRFARLTRLSGRDEDLYAVSIEHVRGGDSLSRAARKYSLRSTSSRSCWKARTRTKSPLRCVSRRRRCRAT
jgi:hypothetical protein